MLVLVRSSSYTPDACFSEEFPLTLLMLVLLRSFSYTPHASFSEELLLHTSSQILWGVSLTCLMAAYVRSVSDIPLAGSV